MDTKTEQTTKTNLYCALQSTGLTISDNIGRVTPCCHFDPEHNLNLPSIFDIDRLDQNYTNSKDMVKSRKQTSKGIHIPECVTCWNRENIYNDSRRLYFNTKITGRGNFENLELALDNTCNLMCRICAPKHSSKWSSAKDVLEELAKITNQQQLYKPVNVKKKYGDNLKRVLGNTDLENLKSVTVVGGEPFFSKNFSWFIDLLYKKTDYKNLSFDTITNATIIPDTEIIEKMLKFKHIKVKFSIDAVGDLFNVTRHGVPWETVYSNLKIWATLAKKHGNLDIRANPTISILNINKMQDIVDTLKPLGIVVVPHMLQGPSWLVPEQIPLEYRKKWQVRYDHREQGGKMNKMICSERKVPNVLDKFLNCSKVLDSHYGVSFKDVNPTIWKLARKMQI